MCTDRAPNERNRKAVMGAALLIPVGGMMPVGRERQGSVRSEWPCYDDWSRSWLLFKTVS